MIKQRKGGNGIGFEDVERAIKNNQLLAIVENSNQKDYAGQEIMVVAIDGYAYHVPFRKEKDVIFLITAYPSRKSTKFYLPTKENDSKED